MKNKMSASMFQKEQVIESIRQSFVKLNPRMMIKNPIMFTVEVVTVIMLVVTLLSLFTPEYGTFGYNLCVFLILFVKPVIRSLPMERLLKDWLPLTKVPLPVNLLR